eukprot:TRINITY_DN1711_c0_g1_i4.p2 TRINITY_DN1711_c0_g1~~TRINITY_DN1711_c0_g1_i4.p2  ORF type:complete len:116 (-),score=38.41 TRINITY_DN1711_c0_g1_i4:741-1088(-)
MCIRDRSTQSTWGQRTSMEQTEQRINVEAAKLTPVDCDGEQSTHADERFGDRAFHEEAASTCAPLSSSLLKKRKRGEKAEAMSSIADRDATISEIITHPSLSSHPDEVFFTSGQA